MGLLLYNTIQYNTKSLFRNGGHQPIIQNSHNTILTMSGKLERTSDGGNGNHSVSLPIILIKIKVDQMLPSSNISSLLVSIL